ncbi:transketolase family protein [Desulfopila aestuarii]|uniref:Transketolase n=1 Tax=Desulfopila aestuarii DSM 18488 TaxID=1121416 RepID=A0A1M7XWA1_9BACT|nr:transketolase C-terminal domain-containing protein [Desulfopila aestuarii]SHO42808.1 transketolase [Desulfopila aestuarii DSM 18488]
MLGNSVAQDLRDVMVDSLTSLTRQGLNIAVLVSDSTSTAKIAPFKQEFPDRLINVGIAEQSLIGTAAGMALGGFVAVTANAAPFLVHRANEQVKNDVCYSNSNVKLMGLNAGVCYGPLASTHHAIDDVSIMRGFGNILIFTPSDGIEARQVFAYALNYVGPVYIRMDSAKLPNIHDEGYIFRPGQPDILRLGNDITIIAMGSTAHEAVAAGKLLQEDGISADIISLPSIRPLEPSKIVESLCKTSLAITVEEHSQHGGIGSLVSEIIAEHGIQCRLKRLGFPEGKFAVSGPRDEMRKHIGIDAASVARTAKEMIK